MSFELDRRDRRVLTIAGVVFALLVVAAVILAPDPGSTLEIPTTYSAASGGAKAAWLLLKESGYRVERWERPPTELPAPAGKVLILAEPGEFPDETSRRALKDFVLGGGRVIATGTTAGFVFENGGVRSETVTVNTWQEARAVRPSRVTRAAPRITLSPQSYWPSGDSGAPLYADDAGKVRIVGERMGSGEIMFWASATPLTNAGIKEPGNLEFFLASLGDRDRITVLWDEYFHGYRQSLVRTAAKTPLAWLLVHLAIVALAVVFTYSRRSGPVFVAGDVTRLSPLEFVRTLGHLYERAGAASVAVDVSHSRFRYWLTRRLGMPGDASPEVLEAALAERWAYRDRNFRTTLAACEAARGQLDLKPKDALRLVRALHRQRSALTSLGR